MKAIEFIRQSRKQLGLTQRQIAAITGYTKQSIVDYENGRARVPGDLVLQVQAMLEVKKTTPTKEAIQA